MSTPFTLYQSSRPYGQANSASAVEIRFPRIARELAKVWHSPRAEAYLDSLIIDTRGNRAGFPPDVQDELMFLSGLIWHLHHPNDRPRDHTRPERFTFSAANEDDLRLCATSGAWIL